MQTFEPIVIDYDLKVVDVIATDAVKKVYDKLFIETTKTAIRENLIRNSSREYISILKLIRDNIDDSSEVVAIITSINVNTYIGNVITSKGAGVQFRYKDKDGANTFTEGTQIWFR